jgi:hypothetical protein
VPKLITGVEENAEVISEYSPCNSAIKNTIFKRQDNVKLKMPLNNEVIAEYQLV